MLYELTDSCRRREAPSASDDACPGSLTAMPWLSHAHQIPAAKPMTLNIDVVELLLEERQPHR